MEPTTASTGTAVTELAVQEALNRTQGVARKENDYGQSYWEWVPMDASDPLRVTFQISLGDLYVKMSHGPSRHSKRRIEYPLRDFDGFSPRQIVTVLGMILDTIEKSR